MYYHQKSAAQILAEREAAERVSKALHGIGHDCLIVIGVAFLILTLWTIGAAIF